MWGFTHAQSSDCQDLFFSLDGANNAILDQSHYYNLSLQLHQSGAQDLTWDAVEASTAKISYLQYVIQNATINSTVYFNNQYQQSISEKKFYYAFPKIWNYTIKSNINYGSCSYELQKEIKVFERAISYFGAYHEDLNYDMINNIEQQWIHLYTVVLASQQQFQDKLSDNIQQHIPYIQSSKDIYINLENYGNIFSLLSDIEASYDIDMNQKNIFIISETNKSIVKKLLASLLKQTGIVSIFVINPGEFESMLLKVSIGQAPYTENFLANAAVQFSSNNFSYTLSQVIDYLVFHGFPVKTVSLLLALTLAILIVVFCKQVVGLSSFGVYYPILFALSLHTVGLKTSIGLLLVAFLASFLVKVILKNVTVLVSAKLSLYLIAYIILLFIGLALYQLLWLPQNNFLVFSNPMVLIVVIVVLMVGKKIWNKTFPLKSLAWRKTFLRFLLLSAILYGVISSENIQHYLLLHPWIVIAIGIATLLIGKYTGLQLVEYIRFWPLVKKYWQKTAQKAKKKISA